MTKAIDRDILREAARATSHVDGVFQVDAEPIDGDSELFVDIDTDDGYTFRLSLTLAPEPDVNENGDQNAR